MKKQQTLFYKFLKKIGLIKPYNVNKDIMCKKAQSICTHNCNSCALSDKFKSTSIRGNRSKWYYE